MDILLIHILIIFSKCLLLLLHQFLTQGPLGPWVGEGPYYLGKTSYYLNKAQMNSVKMGLNSGEIKPNSVKIKPNSDKAEPIQLKQNEFS